MTKLGKYLVFINLVLSLCFLGVAAGVASNRIDWPGTAKGETKAGIALKADEIKSWQQEANSAYTRYSAALPELLKVEEERPAKRKWYADQLSILETGKDTDGKAVNTVNELVYQKGQLQIDPKTGSPMLRPIQNLQPKPQMIKTLADTQDEIKRVMGDVATHMKEEERLTTEINGDPKAKTKGLRDLLAEEVSAEKNLQGELEYLRPLRYNRQVEAALLLKRQLALKARLEELKNIGVAAR
jgi:hypothetical protein